MSTRASKLTKLTPKGKVAADVIHVTAKEFNTVVDLINYSDRGTVTQATNITTGVTLNAAAGVITTVSLTTAASTVAGPFTVTNNVCLSDSVVKVSVEYANGKTGFPVALVEAVATGSFNIRLLNVHTSAALNDVVKIHFVIL